MSYHSHHHRLEVIYQSSGLVLIFLGCNVRATLLEIVTVCHSKWDDIKHILSNQLPKDTARLLEENSLWKAPSSLSCVD